MFSNIETCPYYLLFTLCLAGTRNMRILWFCYFVDSSLGVSVIGVWGYVPTYFVDDFVVLLLC
jgi:hypothetical protein